MNIYTGLLFHHGHIADPALAVSLAADDRRDEGDDARRRADSRPVQARRRAIRGSFRRGAIAAACCSTALSPFR